MSNKVEKLAPREKGELKRDIAVLGGGLAGLAAGMQSGGAVFEAEDHVGGVAASDRVGDFTFDRGIHVLQTRNQKILDLFEELGIGMERRERRASIFARGTYTAYPFQVNTVGLPVGLRLRCVLDFLRRDNNPEPQDYEQWMHKNIGRGLADTFLVPYSEKFWRVHPREMTFEWTGNRVPKPETWQVIRGALWSRQTKIGTNASFLYPAGPGGYGSVATALAGRVDDLHLERRAVEVDPDSRTVRFESGPTLRYNTLVNTLPLPALVGMMSVPVPAAVREAAGRLRTNSILVVNLGIERSNISDHHWLHFPEQDISFFRLSFPFNLDPATAPKGHSSISVEVAYTPGQRPNTEATVERVIKDLVRVGVLRADDRINETHTRDIPLAYCIFDQYRKAAVRTISGWLAERDIITCGRYGLWAYFWSDEAISSGLNAGDKALRLTDNTAADELLDQQGRSGG